MMTIPMRKSGRHVKDLDRLKDRLYHVDEADLILLPKENEVTPRTIAAGTRVIAIYPDTTSFYRATLTGQFKQDV